MMKIYYSAGACSMSCVIAFEEMGIKYEPILLNWDQPGGNVAEVNRLNPLGTAPVCVTEKGQVITQNIAVLEYFSDLNPQSKLLPSPGTIERAQTMSWLSFAASDFHKSFAPLFALKGISQNEMTRKEVRSWAIQGIEENLLHLDKNLEGKDFITGKSFTIADCYLFVVSNWAKNFDIPMSTYKNLGTYLDRVQSRPAVRKTLKNAGIL